MNTCKPKKAQFVDGCYDTLSSELGHDRGHASSAFCVGPRHASHGASIGSSPKISGVIAFLLVVALVLLLELLL